VPDLHQIIAFADRLLDAGAIADYCPNGLQVEGLSTVTGLTCGVSACMPLFERALEDKSELILVHHGLFWDGESRVVRGSLKKRLKFLLDHGISLAGYHLPLDRHPEVGNNAQLFLKLGLVDRRDFGRYKGQTISCMGKLPEPLPFDAFLARVNRVLGVDQSFHLPFGPGLVRTVALCSGGAPDLVREAIAVGADVFLTGEVSEYVYHLAREEGIHYIGAGHHATERFGVMALGEKIAAEFGVRCQFVDIPNPI